MGSCMLVVCSVEIEDEGSLGRGEILGDHLARRYEGCNM